MTGCSNNGPSVDPRCEDAAFADAHPDLCTNFARLFLVPDMSVIEPGDTVTYTVILRAGSVELEVEQGVVFSVANESIAVINDIGIATGVIPGVTTVTATWQGKTAHAQIQVVQSCAELNNDYVILIDNSKSMTQSMASAPSKLAFAKITASSFAASVNYAKDRVAAYRFNDDATRVIDFSVTAPPVQAAIGSIPSSTGKTDLADAIQDAADYFVEQGTTGVRVIILFSDGEKNDGVDPVPIAKAFKDSGGIIAVVATRAWGIYFETLNKIASAGFFLSAYAATESTIGPTLSSLKSLVCGGDCAPEPGTFPTAQLNYYGFINWDVTAGRVDLVGLGKWDVRPGHGLYVDLQGTGNFEHEDFGLGQITSKSDFTFEDGKTYRFTIEVGGSSSHSAAGDWSVRVRAGDQLDAIVPVLNAIMPLTLQTFEWTQVGDFTGKIILEQYVASGHPNIGACIDEVTLLNLTDEVTMLYDNFDTENPTTIDPDESYSYFGCLDGAVGTQTADPTPPTPIIAE